MAVADFLQDASSLPRIICLRATCKRVGHWARWTEGCWCHEHLLVDCSSWHERKQVLLGLGIPNGVCPWAGKRGTELALDKCDEMEKDITLSATEALEEWRPTQGGQVAQEVYATLVCDAEALGFGVAGEISLKLGAMWKCLP